MTNKERTWISMEAYERLQKKLTTLRELYSAAAADGRFDESIATTQLAWHARIQQIHDLLVNALVGEDPPDDGIAEPGMVLTVRYDGTGDTETFLLGVRGAESGEMEIYSNQSPLGAALESAHPGERRSYISPSGAALTVTLLKAVPHGMYIADMAHAGTSKEPQRATSATN